MARKVIWSHVAACDLENIAEYISRDSDFYAAAFVQKIIDKTRSLKEFSERGRIVPELCKSNIREIFINEYSIIYGIEEKRVIILGIIHGRRDLYKLWKREKRG